MKKWFVRLVKLGFFLGFVGIVSLGIFLFGYRSGYGAGEYDKEYELSTRTAVLAGVDLSSSNLRYDTFECKPFDTSSDCSARLMEMFAAIEKVSLERSSVACNAHIAQENSRVRQQRLQIFDTINSATALCADGTFSYSQSRSGTCSHHGGVASWY